jgi:cytochrome P450
VDEANRYHQGKNQVVKSGHLTLFDLLLNKKQNSTYQVPPTKELVDHAFLFSLAGIDTTSTVLTFATHSILSSPHVLRKLKAELREAEPFIKNEFDFEKVRRLPYLVSSLYYLLKELLLIHSICNLICDKRT